MKLLSATVRGYRVHEETTIDFDEARTLVGGANETGKSTFIEAVHRGLFLKAKVTGDAKKSMDSFYWRGPPEVEVRFEARGDEYHLVKSFAGQKGSIRLTKVGGSTWQGEEAQARLAELLGAPDVGGPGVLKNLPKQWGHLWVWQGDGGDDPAAQQDNLFGAASEHRGSSGDAVCARWSRDCWLLGICRERVHQRRQAQEGLRSSGCAGRGRCARDRGGRGPRKGDRASCGGRAVPEGGHRHRALVRDHRDLVRAVGRRRHRS